MKEKPNINFSEPIAPRLPVSTEHLPGHPDTLLESGVLAHRYQRGKPLVLMVSKRRSKQWGIPKGKIKAPLSLGENAAKEAFEEAGVIGNISPHAVAVFRTTKRDPSRNHHRRVVEVWVYLLEVTEVLSKWPEKGKRVVRWVSCDRAAIELGEPALADLCRRLSRLGAER